MPKNKIIQGLSEISQFIYNKVGAKPTYNQYYTAYLDAYRKYHPNSTAPKNYIIEMHFDNHLVNPLLKGL